MHTAPLQCRSMILLCKQSLLIYTNLFALSICISSAIQKQSIFSVAQWDDFVQCCCFLFSNVCLFRSGWFVISRLAESLFKQMFICMKSDCQSCWIYANANERRAPNQTCNASRAHDLWTAYRAARLLTRSHIYSVCLSSIHFLRRLTYFRHTCGIRYSWLIVLFRYYSSSTDTRRWIQPTTCCMGFFYRTPALVKCTWHLLYRCCGAYRANTHRTNSNCRCIHWITLIESGYVICWRKKSLICGTHNYVNKPMKSLPPDCWTNEYWFC